MTAQHTVGQYLRGAILGGTLLVMAACGSQAVTGTQASQQPKQTTTLETVVEATTPSKAPAVPQRPKHVKIEVQPLGVKTMWEDLGGTYPSAVISIAYKDGDGTYQVVHCIPSVKDIPSKGYFDEKLARVTDITALIEAHQKTGEGGVHLIGYQSPSGGVDATMIAVDGLGLPCMGR